MISQFEQTLLFAVTGLVVLGTLVVWIVAYVRRYGRRNNDHDREED